VVGAGADAAQAFAPYRTTIDGQRVAILSATQVIAANLTSTWTATSSQGGVASALDPTQLIQAVQAARRTSDTVVVYLDWGAETVACPDPQQEPLAEQLVKAGADIVVGTGAHVLLGAGYLGSAYVEYGLGNLAFYDDTAPETDSGVLLITVEGRHILGSTFRPATILGGLPQPLTGTPAATAIQSWLAARSCTNLSAAPTATQASERGETTPFVLPTTTTTTVPTTAPANGATTTTAANGATTTTAAARGSATTTTHSPTVTKPTDNAG
jgi:poly-gamma-glutamate synthesis protein (capsule biosynthesis protein)